MALLALTGLTAYQWMRDPVSSKLKPSPQRDWSDIYALYTGETNRGKLRLKYPDPQKYGMMGNINHQYGYVPKVDSYDLTRMDWGNPNNHLIQSKPFWDSYRAMMYRKDVINNGWGPQIFKCGIYTGDQNQFGPQVSSRVPLWDAKFTKGGFKRKQKIHLIQ
jgi:hypothetical protein